MKYHYIIVEHCNENAAAAIPEKKHHPGNNSRQELTAGRRWSVSH